LKANESHLSLTFRFCSELYRQILTCT